MKRSLPEVVIMKLHRWMLETGFTLHITNSVEQSTSGRPIP